jgi:hypothetical protein
MDMKNPEVRSNARNAFERTECVRTHGMRSNADAVARRA